ncbi:MAG: extracellular solute-binding protein [Clostridiales bacterium]|nr:extracellular solute-binding protein [Clostridiales bacterium]
MIFKAKFSAALCLLLAALTVITAAGCSGGGGSAKVTAAAVSEAETEAEITTTGETPDIPDADFEGAGFNILYPQWALYNHYYFAEEADGDAVNDALFERMTKIEEQLNIDVTTELTDNAGKILPAVQRTVLSGDDVYNLTLTHCATSLVSYVSERLVLNWNDIPHIDMEKSWWNQYIRDSMEISGILPFNANSFILPDVNSIFFNYELLEAFSLEKPYDLVLEGRWTWDVLTEMAEQVSADINGDGVFDENDRYGFMFENDWQPGSFPTAAGQFCIRTDKEGVPYFALDETIMTGLCDKLAKLMHGGNAAFTWPYSQATDPNAGGSPPVSFNEGRALFYYVPLSLAARFRENEADFGIIPVPKYDEAQNEYYTLNWSGFMCVPASAKNQDLAGMTVELLGYYNQQIFMPVFYDILLGQKVSRDEDSIAMLDIIFDHAVYDLGINLGVDFYCIIRNVVTSSKPTYASYIESKMNVLQNHIDKYHKAHLEFNA